MRLFGRETSVTVTGLGNGDLSKPDDSAVSEFQLGVNKKPMEETATDVLLANMNFTPKGFSDFVDYMREHPNEDILAVAEHFSS